MLFLADTVVLRILRTCCIGVCILDFLGLVLRDSIQSVAFVVFCKLGNALFVSTLAFDLRFAFSFSVSLTDVSRSLLEDLGRLLDWSGVRGGFLSKMFDIYITIMIIKTYYCLVSLWKSLPICSPVSLLWGCTMATCLPPVPPVSISFPYLG